MLTRFRAFAVLVPIVLTLGACASKPAATLKQLNWREIEAVRKVEIFYNPEEHTVVHDFGQSSRQGVMAVSGLFGPIGLLAGTAAMAAATRSAFDLAAPRSKEFNEALTNLRSTDDMNAGFAQLIAQDLQRQGVDVKLTRVPRLSGSIPGLPPDAKLRQEVITPPGGPTGSAGGMTPATVVTGPAPVLRASHGFTMTPGYTPLLLRITTGYTAAESFADFRPFQVVEYGLVRPGDGSYMLHGRWAGHDGPPGPTYGTWDKLLGDVGSARHQLRQRLLAQARTVHQFVFEQ